MNNSSYTIAVPVNSSLYPLPETRILVYDHTGNLKPIKVYHDDTGKKWIEARPNSKFVIEIKNNSSSNTLAVVSVDGLNVIDGKRAELKNERGYVVDKYSSTKVSGWRTSVDEVREFVFTANKNDSFSHKLGADESDVGVIGIGFFKEIVQNWTYTYQPWIVPLTYPIYPTYPVYSGTTTNINTRSFENGNSNATTYSTATTLGAASTPTSCCVNSSSLNGTVANGLLNETNMSMATKQGVTRDDKVHTSVVNFESVAAFTDIIYYDSYENLVKKGIIKKTKTHPEPFANNGFCPSL
jgi:hypothetical protein